MLRSLIFLLVFYLNTAVFLIVGSPLLFGPRSWAMAALAAHGRASIWWLRVIVGTRLEVRGRENLPEGPALIASKHQSAWDTFGIVPLTRDPAMVMKQELLKIPLYGWFCRKFEMIFVRRELGPTALRRMVRDAKDRVAEGRDIVIFPEGTRRAVGAPPDYKPGIVLLYEALGVPCVPVALNSGVFWPRRSILRRPGTLVVEFLPAIPPGLPRREFTPLLQERIETASARLAADAAMPAQSQKSEVFSIR
jgi:1-acyl-sn-glycerol-3-phosphate acyltransferase